jgi:release factor glutamine methyltransferase
MTVRDALREGAAALRGSETPFLDASLLLAEALGVGTDSIHASHPDPVEEAALEAYRSKLARRASGLPVAYVLGRKEFWGRSFTVDERVLVPRPDTELLVQTALALGDALAAAWAGGGAREGGQVGGALRVHEKCCGSLCVAASVAADRPTWLVSASDLSPGALEVAATNAAALLPPDRPGGPLALMRSDLLEAVEGGFDLILANPPYVPSAETDALLAQGWSEPRMALDGGEDGLALIERLVPQAADRLAPGGWLLVEADGSQAPRIRELLGEAGFTGIDCIADLAGIPRLSIGRREWKS